jgi:hypothetical protein
MNNFGKSLNTSARLYQAVRRAWVRRPSRHQCDARRPPRRAVAAGSRARARCRHNRAATAPPHRAPRAPTRVARAALRGTLRVRTLLVPSYFYAT